MSPALRAQSTFGTILGSVRDASGQAVSGAKVKATNLEQNFSREVITEASGDYELPNLAPGRYSVVISFGGFQPFTAEGLSVASRQPVRLDAELEVGTVEQRIDVTETAGVIATDTATVTSALGNERIVNLPVNYRASESNSPFQLIATLPGVQSNNGRASDASFSINGALPAQSSYSVDGITIQSPRGGGALANVFPSAESIAELKVQGVGNNAEYSGVGDVTAVSRSGSNSYHGSAFWYYQSDALDAKRYGTTTKEEKSVHNAGFSLGGPVAIPKLYNGRNKSFFFAAFEGRSFPRTSLLQNDVPTAAMRAGDFSREPGTITDPSTNAQFPGNKIPDSRISPIAKKFLDQFYPLPNFGGADVFHPTNYVVNKPADRPGNQFDIRGDQVLTQTQSVYVRYSRKDATAKNPSNLLIPTVNYAPEYRSLVVSHNYSIKANLLNEFRVGFSSEGQNQDFDNFDGRTFTQGLGFQGLPPLPFNGLPEVNIDGITGIGVDRVQSNDLYKTWQINENLTWIRGRHTMKFGGDIRWNRSKTALGFYGADNFGTYDFVGNFTGNAFADFLLGIPRDSAVSNVQSDNDGRSTEYHLFAQDSFRVGKRLTLEFGLRWQWLPPLQDQSGNIGNFDRTVPKTGRVIYPSSPEAAKLLAPGLLLGLNACPGTPNLPPNNLTGIPGVGCTPFVTAAEAGLPEGLRIDYKKNFYPRFGFAYRMFNGGTVLRGSWGMFNMPIRGAVFYSLTGTAQTDVRNFVNSDASGQPVFAWPNIRTGGSGVEAADYGTNYFGTANAIDFRNPYAMQWSMTVDHSLGFNTGLRVSYIGMKSTHLPFAPNLNQSYYSTEYYQNQPLTQRPFPYWFRIESRDTGGNAIYNAAQIEVNRRFSGGLAFTAAYTLAKNINDVGGPNPTDFAGETGGGRIMDSLNRAANRGNDYATRRHRFISSFLYQLPLGRGRHFGSGWSRLADAFVGGWQLSGIFLAQSGPYLTPDQGGVGDPSGTGSGFYRTQRPDRIGDGSVSNPNRDGWLDRGAFVCPGRAPGSLQYNCNVGVNPSKDPPPIGRFGNAGVGIIEGPGLINLSAGAAKYFSITERFRIGVEGTFTNVLNRTNLADPVTNITRSNFGVITSAREADFGGSRNGQLGVRFEF